MRKLILFGFFLANDDVIWGSVINKSKLIINLIHRWFCNTKEAKKVPNTMSNFMYHRDAFNYNSSVQPAYNAINSPIREMRQPYFDSTEYNYQKYYNTDGVSGLDFLEISYSLYTVYIIYLYTI